MLDLGLLRARAALTASHDPADVRERRRLGAAVLASVRALALSVEALLPELASLTRFASRPDAAGVTLGWLPPDATLTEAPHLSVLALPSGLEVSWGFALPRGERAGRGRYVAEVARRRRALGDTLTLKLTALRAAGAELRASRRDPTALSEDEWLRAAAGSVVFPHPAPELPPGALLPRLVADRVARLSWLVVHLGGAPFEPRAAPSQTVPEALESLRSLRWDERALGVGTAPQDAVPLGRTFYYDPASGWFAPSGLAAFREHSAPRARLLGEACGVAAPSDALDRLGRPAPVAAGLHARLERWLAARGVRGGATDSTVLVPGDVPRPDEVPALEALVARALEDPSGDVAVALAGLLSGAPWSYADALDPAAVAARVPARFAPSAARGVSRLAERGVLARGVTGALDAVGDCLSHPALRPVLARAVERAVGHLEVFSPGARERAEAAEARAWELGALAPRAATLESVARRFCVYARASGLAFDLELARAFVVGLRAKPFAVLTGVSGTGKTRLAQLFARFMTDGLPGGPSARLAIVPVRPDWLDSRGLLGYFNVLHAGGTYEDTAALRVILRAVEHPEEPHFLVLDEMNLARVEHYLAEVLSAMESGEPIPLHGRPGGVPSVDGARVIPPDTVLPPNLFVVGTVNVDETTHAFSPKVLDRAWTWEFAAAPPTALLEAWLRERRATPPATEDERRALAGPPPPEDPVRALVLAMGRDGVGARIDRLFEVMASHGRPFGFRVATEVLRFVHLCEREGLETPPSWWLDQAVLGKVLPRLSGTRRELEPLLRALLETCAPSTAARPTQPSDPARVAEQALTPRDDDLPRSAAKLRELLVRLEAEPFVTFAR